MKGAVQSIHPDLMAILIGLEAHMGFELTITSGKRDGAHNDAVGGVPDSEHTYDLAEGADVLCKRSTTRYKMKAWLYERKVPRIGTGRDFLHVGIAADKPQWVEWNYYDQAGEA